MRQHADSHTAEELPDVANLASTDALPDGGGLDSSPFPEPVRHAASTSTSPEPTAQTSHADSVESHALPHYFHGSSEDILDWPVFQSKHNREQIERLIFDPALHSDLEYSSPSTRSRFSATSPRDALEEPRRQLSSTRGIREEDVSELVERFLANVHTKNPILDSNALRGIVKSIAGEGFSWDARTCLVVGTPSTASCASC